ncbi:flagellar biosynthesis protein FlgJ [Pseudodesulfovibrio cashew]|uniref:Flagellar biosynthesis protein FlgJ n=1 Tax=Pseudodesulfovibrio cashew TaxID=2678688 RepID=A0A6I6JMY8_9BACT|nr:rod-binding protein [Pseudodesulfovibrio cashew]QGY41612.1 flagellar biosynthesis protein FlgJ [Pseudodesulfovibrio cashew]
MTMGIDPQILAKQASDTSEVVRFKQEMDGLKQRLTDSSGNKEKALRQACQNFEAVFISKLWQGMKSTVPKEGYLHSKQEEQYTGMFDRDFAEKMAQSGGIGLADMIYDQLSQKLKETSRDALSGAVSIKPLAAEPIALDSGKKPIPLSTGKQGMTLEDWGGAAEEKGEAPTVAAAEPERTKAATPRLSDVDVKARLDELARKLEAERIKDGLLGRTASVQESFKDRDTAGQVGRKLAKIG